MEKRFKKLLLAMVAAVLALVVGASTAAAKEEVHIEGTPPFTLKAEQQASANLVYTLEGGQTIKCKKVTWAGSAEKNVLKTVELTPTYSECTAFGMEATVTSNNHCVDAFTFALLALAQYKAAIAYDIACLAATALKASTASCEVEIGSQTGLEEGGANELETSPKTLEVDTVESGIKYTKVKDGFLCPLNGTGVKTDGKLEGKLDLKAFEGSTQKGIYIE